MGSSSSCLGPPPLTAPSRAAHLEVLRALPCTLVLVTCVIERLYRGDGLDMQPRELKVPGKEAEGGQCSATPFN